MKKNFKIEEKEDIANQYMYTHKNLKEIAEDNNTNITQIRRILKGKNIARGNKINFDNKHIYEEKYSQQILINFCTRDDK